DLIANTAGSLVGALAFALVVRALAGTASRSSLWGLPLEIVARPYGIACLGEAFYPFFSTGERTSIAATSLDRLTTTVLEFRWESFAQMPFQDFLLFLPAGAFAVLALDGRGWQRWPALGAVTLCGAVLMAAAEAGHGVLGMEIRGGAALLHAVAIAAGGAAGVAWVRRAPPSRDGSERGTLLLSTYVAVMVLWTLRPYQLEPTLSAVLEKVRLGTLIPMRSLARTMGVFSIVHVLTSFLLYVPVGAVLAIRPLRRRGWLAGFAPAAYLAVVSEVLQAGIIGRSFDVTDPMIQAAGAAVGWLIMRRAGFGGGGALPSDRDPANVVGPSLQSRIT
ncbi:MAG: VanZ family protein, partial [Dehalococcoidia bacterium]